MNPASRQRLRRQLVSSGRQQSTSLLLAGLEVLLERGRRRDRLALVLVLERLRVAGVVHAARALRRRLLEGDRLAPHAGGRRDRRLEGRDGRHEGEDDREEELH